MSVRGPARDGSRWLLVPLAFLAGGAIVAVLFLSTRQRSPAHEHNAGSAARSASASTVTTEAPAATDGVQVSLAREEAAIAEKRLQLLRARRVRLSERASAKAATTHEASAAPAPSGIAESTGGTASAALGAQAQSGSHEGARSERGAASTHSAGKGQAHERAALRHERQSEKQRQRQERQARREQRHGERAERTQARRRGGG